MHFNINENDTVNSSDDRRSGDVDSKSSSAVLNATVAVIAVAYQQQQ